MNMPNVLIQGRITNVDVTPVMMAVDTTVKHSINVGKIAVMIMRTAPCIRKPMKPVVYANLGSEDLENGDSAKILMNVSKADAMIVQFAQILQVHTNVPVWKDLSETEKNALTSMNVSLDSTHVHPEPFAKIMTVPTNVNVNTVLKKMKSGFALISMNALLELMIVPNWQAVIILSAVSHALVMSDITVRRALYATTSMNVNKTVKSAMLMLNVRILMVHTNVLV